MLTHEVQDATGGASPGRGMPGALGGRAVGPGQVVLGNSPHSVATLVEVEGCQVAARVVPPYAIPLALFTVGDGAVLVFRWPAGRWVGLVGSSGCHVAYTLCLERKRAGVSMIVVGTDSTQVAGTYPR